MMRVWKVALGLSLAANAAFAIWTFRQRAVQAAANRELEMTQAALTQQNAWLDRLNIDAAMILTELKQTNANAEIAVAETGHLTKELKQVAQESRDQTLSLIASNDQLDAFLEEHEHHVK